MSDGTRKSVFVVVAVLIIGMWLVQNRVSPVYQRLRKSDVSVTGGDKSELMVQLPSQFLIASVTGFKEVIAGALWVRADTFFHEDQYDAIIPIVRMVTWLDPHNIDVFTTGAWHLDYNFVDEDQRSDKRYIPASIGLLREGIKNNPYVYDLYFELGWTHYNRKLQDYTNAVKYMEMACKHPGFDPNTGEDTPRPEFIDRMLAHEYELAGRFDDAIRVWKETRGREMAAVEKARKEHKIPDMGSVDVDDKNMAMLYLRLGWRYGDMKAYGKGVEILKQLEARKSGSALPWAIDGAVKDYEHRLATNNPPHDALIPLDAGNPHSFCIDEVDHKIMEYLLHYKSATTPELAAYVKTNRWLILNRLRKIQKISKKQVGKPVIEYYAGERSGKKKAWWIDEELIQE